MMTAAYESEYPPLSQVQSKEENEDNEEATNANLSHRTESCELSELPAHMGYWHGTLFHVGNLYEENEALSDENKKLKLLLGGKKLLLSKRLVSATQQASKWQQHAKAQKVQLQSANRRLSEMKQHVDATAFRASQTELDNQELKQKLQEAFLAADLAQRQAEASDEAQKSLYQVIDSAVVKRKDGVGADSFPSGEMIARNFRSSQERAQNLFFDLADLMSDNDEGVMVKHFQTVLDHILAKTHTIVLSHLDKWVKQKEEQLESFLQDEEASQTPLTKLFYSSIMQRLVRKSVKQKFPRKVLLAEASEELTWACSTEILKHIDMEDCNIYDIATDLCRLHEQCRFSDPPCFLYPPIGDVAAFHQEKHQQCHSKSFPTKAHPNAKVRVLYPGLYYEDPTINDTAKPIQKTLVVLLENISAEEELELESTSKHEKEEGSDDGFEKEEFAECESTASQRADSDDLSL